MDNSVDAINASLFPDVVHSVPFIFGLFGLEVETVDGELSTTLLDYMLEHQRVAWWSYVLGLP
ncbi:MAG: chain-length determining protein, partial [Bacteroidales bacterium]|nr:chain-length determining protein [Bacteroidales bacterium]